ncbi:MAG: putative sulfate exporter family transporter [Bacteroidales bacterium]|nr:putative sulfate exporter family transporter [Bacteroidales bacterium]
MNANFAKGLFIVLLIASCFVPTAVALFAGIIFSLIIGNPYPAFSKKVSKILLQVAVVGLGFNMNLFASLEAGKEGMIFTIVSVIGVMILGVCLGKLMKVNTKNAYLISAGTAICGGSAIAAVAPVIDADEHDTSIAMATIFVLNAIALFIFPVIGEKLGMSQNDFGTWAAIAIHDTSSVVGAGAAYGDEALEVATTIKLTRALWIIPLALVSSFIFHSKGKKISVPWFIFLFVLAMIFNTYIPLPEILTSSIVMIAKKMLCVTLFLIGCGLTVNTLKTVGVKPLVLGVLLWFIISVSTLTVIYIL